MAIAKTKALMEVVLALKIMKVKRTDKVITKI
jgi:hypothetical protein